MSRSFRNSGHKEFQRKAGSRNPFERILIVCEGEKSEPGYFNEIKAAYRIPTLVTVCSARQRTEPMQIIETAKKIFEQDPDFEWIYVVFDRDNHLTYQEALTAAKALNNTLRTADKKSVRFIAIPTVPCFEFWLLLHYNYQDNRSNAAQILKSLKSHLPEYAKGMAGLFQATQEKLRQAETNAGKLRTLFTPDNGFDPYTDIDQLIQELRRIKERSN